MMFMIMVMMITMMLITVMMMMILITMMMITMMSRACGNIGTTFEALKQHSTATTYHEQVKSSAAHRKENKFLLEET